MYLGHNMRPYMTYLPFSKMAAINTGDFPIHGLLPERETGADRFWLNIPSMMAVEL